MSADRRIAAILFACTWLSCVFIGPGGDYKGQNSVPRLGLAFSILERGALDIDQVAPFTIDRAMHSGHYYLDKAPGQTFFLLPAVAAWRALAGVVGLPTAVRENDQWTNFWALSNWLAVSVTSALFVAATVASVYLFARHLGSSEVASLFAALSLAFATPVFGWGTVLFGHAMALGCVFLAFVWLCLGINAETGKVAFRRGLCVGACLGLGVLTDFTLALAGGVIALAMAGSVLRLPSPRLLRLLAGILIAGLPFALLLGAYNASAFGSPFNLGYGRVVGFDGMQQGFFGLTWPKPDVALALLFGTYRGLAWYVPLVLLAPLTWWAAARRLPPSITACIVAVPIFYLLLNASYHYWDGGYSTGPRHLVPGIAFFCLGLAPLWDEVGPGMRRIMLVLVAFGLVACTASASVTMTVEGHYAFPLRDAILPRFFDGSVHNVLFVLGLRNLLSLLGLVVIWGASILAILACLWRRPVPA